MAQKGKIGCVMNILNIKRTGGWTIIELMIVLIIIALLVALAYPSYIDYVRKAKRGEAQQLLLNWAINQEIYRSNNPTYANDAALAVPTNEYYTFPDPTVTATAYTLIANATGDQANDDARDGTPCAQLTLDQNGIKWPPPCWE